MKISRRHALAASGLAALALAGCGGSSDDGASGSGASDGGAARSNGASAGTFPATVTTEFGDVTIEEAPTRVVALGWGDAEIALALGVQPVGASDWLDFGGNGQGPWAADLYDEDPTLIDTLEPSFEAIAALEPDLILDVRGSGDQDRHDRLAEIATTVGIPPGGANWLTTMEDHVALISGALGIPEQGEQLLAQVDAAYADVAEAHPEWEGKTVTAAARTSEGWGAYIEGGGRLETLARFGFVQNPTIAELPADEGGFSVDISSENLDQLEADLIVAFPIYLKPSVITDDAQWQSLEAVEDGRAVVLDGDVSDAFSASTPLASIYAVDQLTPLFEEALPAE
ncbi:iron-siderophore ABC transporter substrate-binding protein [Brachybacterium sp. EE-P12]|uniref:Iron-siderophore ABC transporter substrate-binding protein n=1 Tax=Candidatus Brachybacterium intestinipullorum TaxID=2838512 RepID=A0A9D2PY33_9MICO|nr:iron-siderophore ABC transporter substrate-binding protein [Brachybacterium sp. EE-P12]HJC68105.1 iron-siderophore ABC transporter substrate-binding protein [Candidatus Brachybacterium intestinipullorum]